MDIKLDDATIKTLVSEAILRSLDDKARETLIGEALRSLLEPDRISRGKSVIQVAFDAAVARIATDLAAKAVNEDPKVAEVIRVLLAEAWERVVGPEREKLVESLSGAIRRGITGDRY